MATALERFPAIRLHALYVASNHLHAVVTDADGSLSGFCGFFLGSLAKDVNHMLDRLGPVFHRRFSAEPILDDDALVERIAYLVCNPVADRLTRSWRRWPGVLLWCADGSSNTHSFRRLDGRAYDAARLKVDVSPKDFSRTAILRISAPTDGHERILDPERIRSAVTARSATLTRALRGQSVLGRDGVSTRRPNDTPTRSKRTPRPLCHGSHFVARDAFRRTWRALVAAYRLAAARLRAGEIDARFPPFTFPPWRPLVGPSS